MGMKLFRRTPPPDPAQVAAARTAEMEAEVARERALDQLARDRAAALREEAQAVKVEAEAERQRRHEQAAARRRQAYARLVFLLTTVRTVAPLLLVNTATVGGQFVYAYAETPETWTSPLRAVCAGIYALAAETIALYVGWHAHDALLQGAHATAGRLRRASYAIAAVVGVLNYSHFSDNLEPTAFGVALGVLSLLSPWLWGLHTRRAQHVQLLAEDANLIDKAGAEFSAERRRAFPIRTWNARRWSIEHNIRDPRKAWDGYNAERRRRIAARPVGRLRASWAVLCGRPVPGTPAAVAATPIEPETRDLLNEIRGQARDARHSVAIRAHRLYRQPDTALAIQTASPMANGVATPMAITNGHSADNLMAMAVATEAVPPVANGVATPVATESGQPGGQRTGRTAGHRSGQKQTDNAARIRRIAGRMKDATDAQIAAKAGVSVSTVRRALGKKES